MADIFVIFTLHCKIAVLTVMVKNFCRMHTGII